jgi:hypothetical protein
MIDTILVQEIIEREISSDFEIYEYYDTEKFIIIFWKHKRFDIDDERGQITGPGPVIFDKEKKEYRLLGSGDWFYGDYADSLEISEVEKENRRDHDYLMSLLDGNENDIKYTDSLIEKIKSKIVKRKYVNNDDIDYLSILTGARRLETPFDMTHLNGYTRDNIVVVFNNKIAQQKLIEIWIGIDFEFEVISNTELLLWKIKTSA